MLVRIRNSAVKLIAILALLLPTAVVVMPASLAAAAPTCYGNSCDGIDPAKTACQNDAITLARRDAVTPAGNWGNLELRYSPRCFSNWVRFTPWYGIRAYLGSLSGGIVSGSPWIWRAGVPNSLRGVIGSSGTWGWGYTNWTAMVTASGTTCWSVGVYATETSSSGGGDRNSLGTYNAPCMS